MFTVNYLKGEWLEWLSAWVGSEGENSPLETLIRTRKSSVGEFPLISSAHTFFSTKYLPRTRGVVSDMTRAARSRYVITLSSFANNNSMNTRDCRKQREIICKSETFSLFSNHKVRESRPLHHLTLVHDIGEVISPLLFFHAALLPFL